MPSSPPTGTPPPPSSASLKAWWKQFTVLQAFNQAKKRDGSKGAVFGVPLRDSLRYASVQISTANQNNELYVWGYIPVVVAKCGLYLKEKGTNIEGIFRINGSAKRMRELQTIFETPPRYGKNIQWSEHNFTPHDVASIFRRFLTYMPEPIVPHSLYHDFRAAYSNPATPTERIAAYKQLIAKLPLANQYLLLYVLDLLKVFAKHEQVNKMGATNLAVIFRPAVLNHPAHEMSPEHHKLSQDVLEFLIENQDWFMLDIPPPPRKDSIVASKPGAPAHVSTSATPAGMFSPKISILGRGAKSNQKRGGKGALNGITNQQTTIEEPEDLNVYVGPISDDEEAERGWRHAGSAIAAASNSGIGRSRTVSEKGSPRPPMVDEPMSSGLKSAENVSASAPASTSALADVDINMSSPYRRSILLTPVREASGDMDALVDVRNGKENISLHHSSSLKRNEIASRTGTSGSEFDPSSSGTGIGTGANVSRSSSTKERRTKFEDAKHPRAEEERRGRPLKSGGLFGSVRRSRTVEGLTGPPTAITGPRAEVGRGGTSTPQPGTQRERHFLKKRGSRGDVERIEW